MDIEVFLGVFGALVAYRVVAPLVDFLNPLSWLTRPTFMVKKAILDADNPREEAGQHMGAGKTRDGMSAAILK